MLSIEPVLTHNVKKFNKIMFLISKQNPNFKQWFAERKLNTLIDMSNDFKNSIWNTEKVSTPEEIQICIKGLEKVNPEVKDWVARNGRKYRMNIVEDIQKSEFSTLFITIAESVLEGQK